MLQRIIPFTLPTSWSPSAWRHGSRISGSFLGLMCAVWLGPLASVHAQTTVNYNFEDGVKRGRPTSMRVPPKIITENGNEFMRITGSASDCQSVPSDLCPPRNRSTVTFTSHYSKMPLITSANMRQTYSADIRVQAKCPESDPPPWGNGCSIFEFFQAGDIKTGGYGTHDGTGPSARFMNRNGNMVFENRYNNETKITVIELNTKANAWHNYKLVAVWSHDPDVSKLEVYVDNKRKGVISGHDVNTGPKTNRLPLVKLGLYGDYATGVIDVDNIKVNPSSSSSPAPSVALSAPTNVRVVSGQ
jgi:hypothetical protein